MVQPEASLPAPPPPAAAPAPTRLRTEVEPTPRGRLALLLVGLAAGAAWLSGEANARLAAALLAAPLLVDLALVPRHLHRVAVLLRPRRAIAGAPFREELELSGTGRPLRDLCVHEPRTAMAGQWGFVERLGATPVTLRLQGRSNQRSHLLERVFVLESSWPFGFFLARTALRAQAELVTEPARVRLPAALLDSLHQPARADRTRAVHDGLDFHSLRELRPDEDARAVHALRSAALGVLVRRVTQGSVPHDVGLVLDLRRPPGRNPRLGLRRFEWCMSACATLVDALRANEATVRVLVLGTRTARVTLAAADQHESFLTFLSEADPAPHRPLDQRAVETLSHCEQCYWIAAGGFHDPTEARLLPGGAITLAEETP